MSAPIVFHFPSRGVGGIEWLFLRTARVLAALGVDASVVDFADGFLAKELGNRSGVQILPWRDGETVALPKGAAVVTATSRYFEARRALRFEDDHKLFLWNLHPRDASGLLPPMPIPAGLPAHRHDLARIALAPQDFVLARKIVRSLHRHGGMLFMDEDNVAGTESGLRLTLRPPLFLPVCMEAAGKRVAPAEGGLRRIGWLGRLTHVKASFLAGVMREAAAHAERRGGKLAMTIVGDGPARKLVERSVSPHLDVTFTGVLTGAPLEEALLSVDLLVAMGTSALEGARYGLPTILGDEYCDVEVAPAPLRSRWLDESREYSLGASIGQNSRSVRPHAVGEMLAAMEDPAARRARGEACLRYFEEHHELVGAARLLVKLVERSDSTVATLKREGVWRDGLVRRLGRRVRRFAGKLA